jgi:hypothetical protein
MRTLLAMMVATAAMAGAAHAEVYDCKFPKAGRVIIDVGSKGHELGSITIHGKKHPAMMGSYFVQTNDGSLAIGFMPDMKKWSFMDTGETSTKCTRRK